MIIVRSNPKLALIIVCLTLATSIFTVWMVTRTTDKVAQQGIELQQQANDDVQAQLDAARKQMDAATK
jgi:hypothetical protein